MPLFKSRRTEPTGPLPDGPWSVREGLYERRPMLLRLNDGLSAYAGDSRYSMRAGIAVQLNTPDERGFPSAKGSEALSHFEDDFVDRFCADGGAALAAVLTTNSMREFVYYGSDEQPFRERFRDWALTPKSHRVQLLIARDPKWTVYPFGTARSRSISTDLAKTMSLRSIFRRSDGNTKPKNTRT